MDECDNESGDEDWCTTLGLIRLFLGQDSEDESAAMCTKKFAMEKLVTLDLSLLDIDLCTLLLKVCLNHLQCASDAVACTGALGIVLHMLEEPPVRVIVASECAQEGLLSVIFTNDHLLIDTGYLAGALEIVWCILNLHVRTGSDSDMCNVCNVQVDYCLCSPLTEPPEGEDLILTTLVECLNLVLLQSMDIDLLCQSWAVCSSLLYSKPPSEISRIPKGWEFWQALIAAGVPVGNSTPTPLSIEWDPYPSLLTCYYKGMSGVEWLITVMRYVRVCWSLGQNQAVVDLLDLQLLQMACASSSTCRFQYCTSTRRHMSCSLWSLPPYEGMAACAALTWAVGSCADGHISRLLLVDESFRCRSGKCLAAAETVADILHHAEGESEGMDCSTCAQCLSHAFICSHFSSVCIFLLDSLEDSLLLPLDDRKLTLHGDMMKDFPAAESISSVLTEVLRWATVGMSVCDSLGRPISDTARTELRLLARHFRRREIMAKKLQIVCQNSGAQDTGSPECKSEHSLVSSLRAMTELTGLLLGTGRSGS